jgi:hypothetical protein
MAILLGKGIADALRTRHKVALRIGTVLALGLFIGVSYNLARQPQLLRNLFTYKYDRAFPTHLPLAADEPATDEAPAKCTTGDDCGPHEECTEQGTCTVDWAHTQFYNHTTSSVRWFLQQDFFYYENFILILAGGGVLAWLLFFFSVTRLGGVVLLVMMALLQAAWGLNYYLPMLSPHWSQKYVFEDYYDHCGDRLEEVEVEAYEPLIKKMGMDGLYDYFQSTSKRVCPYNITSWLIVWRGETYHSYNELMPLEKKNIQLQPYLEDINPAMQDLPDDCPVRRLMCPRKFYVFMENRKSNSASSVASGVSGETRKIKRDPASNASSAYRDLDKWEARRVSNENDFFTLFEVTPVYNKGAASCSCEAAQMP